VSSAMRTVTWANEIAKENKVEVFTKNWLEVKNNSVNDSSLNTANYECTKEGLVKVHYLPYIKKKELNYILTSLIGNFPNDYNIVQWKKIIEQKVKLSQVDTVILSCHPYSSLKLAYILKKKYRHINFVVDFRDYINNNLLNDNFSFKWGSKILFKINLIWITHYLKKVNTIISVNKSILKKYEEVFEGKTEIIYNGYYEEAFNKVANVSLNQKFTISLAGSLYIVQDISILCEGLTLFLNSVNNEKVEVNFWGINLIEGVVEKLKKALPDCCINYTDRIPYSEILVKIKKSHILFYVGWKGWKGIYSGKIFDYLGAKRNILIAPNDEDVIEELLKETGAGFATNSAQEFCNYLVKHYENWQKGIYEYNGNISIIEKYTRENQAKKILYFI
jgi:glycosyltransferase involved in cell wall biosynthesis